MVNTQVSRSADPPVLSSRMSVNGYSRIPLGERSTNVQAPIFRAVFTEKELKILVALIEDAVDRFLKERLGIINRHDNAYVGGQIQSPIR